MNELSVEDQEIVDILESYHSAKESEADACDAMQQAEWHREVAQWLREKAKQVILEAKEYRRLHKD